MNGEKFEVPKTLNGRPFYTTHAKGDFALKFLDEAAAREEPFLLYVAFNAPHYPLHAPEADVKKWDGSYDGGWDALRRTRYAKQLKLGIISENTKLSPRPAHIPAWDSLGAKEQRWEADRMEVFAAMVEVMDAEIGRIVARLKAKGEWERARCFYFVQTTGRARSSARAGPTSSRGIRNPIGLMTPVGRTQATHRFASTSRTSTREESVRRSSRTGRQG